MAHTQSQDYPSAQTQDDGARKSPPLSLANIISYKLEEGNIRAAVRLLMSDDSFAAPSEATLARLRDKHPKASLSVAEVPPPLPVLALVDTEGEIRKAVSSFPAAHPGV